MFWMRVLRGSGAPARPGYRHMLVSMLGAGVAIAMLGALSQVSGHVWLMAPFGASCVLAFGLPESPLAQPRSIVGGHVLATLVGLLALTFFGPGWGVGALAVAVSIGLMQWTRTVHAPAGANPLLVLSLAPSWEFLVFPVLLGALLIVGLAYVTHLLGGRGRYPQYWY